MSEKFILSIDQGTTSSRAILFDDQLNAVATGQKEFKQYFPQSGWVEHDAEEIWETTLTSIKIALANGQTPTAIGITNQRETIVIWDARTGKPLHHALVWQDRRTSDVCERLKTEGHEAYISETTGLLLDPYFSATKLQWLLDNVSDARSLADAGHLKAGTIDCYLIWRLTTGQVHATDATNASRTMLYNIHSGKWDDKLLSLFDIPRGVLPEIKDCADDYGNVDNALFGSSAPIYGVAGDQQAALIGQACFSKGMIKATYGTGCFALMNIGSEPVLSSNRLLTTVAYQLDGKRTYALEGSIFIAGAGVQWLRDGLKIIDAAKEATTLAINADDTQDVYLVPAFTGLGAPYWDSECRGAMFGLTRGTGPAELARATLEAVGYQTRDLIEAMISDGVESSDMTLRVDGGMSGSDYTMQFLSDMLGSNVERPAVLETTAMGAAWLAGMYAGIYPAASELSQKWIADAKFSPQMETDIRERKYAGWLDCITRTLTHKGAV